LAYPIQFKGANTVMRAPEGAENVQDMHVFETRGVLIDFGPVWDREEPR